MGITFFTYNQSLIVSSILGGVSLKNVALYGAFDRDNYGDILFPLIFEKYYNQKYGMIKDTKISYYGLNDSDLESKGGLKTVAISKLVNQTKKPDVVIVVGGDVLSTDWIAMYLCFVDSRFNRAILKFMNNFVSDQLWAKLFRADWVLPWILSQKELGSKVKIIYNAVGGSHIRILDKRQKKYLKDKINTCEYISVRDQETKTQLLELNIRKNIDISPDSALIMSILFPLDILSNLITESIESRVKDLDNKYIAVQLNESLGRGNEKLIATQLDSIYEKSGYRSFLIPIGRAPMHDDYIPLKKVLKYCRSQARILEDGNIYDIMYLIANSAMYFGTSLHGAITALSFNVPHIALTNKIPKLSAFLKTWETSPKVFTEFDTIASTFEEYLSTDMGFLKEKRDLLCEQVINNLDHIYQIIRI